MKIIGLTGNSGSGKGTAGNILEEIGAYIIDCDKIAHENMALGGIAYPDIVNHFTNAILDSDGNINRRVLGNIVFNDQLKLKKLNAITHKYVKNVIDSKLEAIKSKANEYKCVVIDAPLLVEAGLEKSVDEVWVVCADSEKKIERIMMRDGITRDTAEKRLQNQMSDEELCKYADTVIHNNGDDMNEFRELIIRKFEELN